ncbi:serine protease inhibitor swm-1-like isoform X1 [Ostrinia nubilalis]|uniref:serine protease inhibitor swm-1-like isoform X1 n=2 Tax=Ostrinia nubilalis TaxID=29057 RepID=UPI003082575A
MSKLTVLIIVTFWIYFIRSEVVKRSSCPANEMQVECAHCGPKRCEELGEPVPCAGGTALCRPECVCIDGSVRAENGTCIVKTECPSCGGDRNATSGCGNHCGNSCSDYKEVNKTCLTGCRYNSCDCRKGYVYHDSLKKCVLPVDCCK